LKSHYRLPVQPKHSPGKHATEWHKQVAADGTVLRTEVGSGLHGTSVSGYDDRDEMGICIEPPSAVIGFRNFEQYEWHTAWEREGGRENRSGAGDLDEVVYSLRKWMRLAMNGNPTVLMPLFAPEDKIVKINSTGRELRERMTSKIVSRLAGARFAGYLHAQRTSLLSHEGKGRDVTRPELIEKYGFDTKYAGHMIRLGYQGVELLSTGKITLPMPEGQRKTVVDIRLGKYTMRDCLTWAEQLEDEIVGLAHPEFGTSDLPHEPDYAAIDQWLSDIYRWHWAVRSVERSC
jgi:uncharacterized protein